MARPKVLRKASEEGRSTTLYLRRGTVQRAAREAGRRKQTLSAFVESTLVEKLASVSAERREGERRAS